MRDCSPEVLATCILQQRPSIVQTNSMLQQINKQIKGQKFFEHMSEFRPRGEAGTSGFLSVSDSDRRVPAELGQESQASSCLRKGTPLASRTRLNISSRVFIHGPLSPRMH